MKKLVCVLGGAVMLAAASVMADPYVGVIGSQTDVSLDASVTNVAGDDWTLFNYDVAQDNSYGVRVGYQADSMFAVEARYVRGKYDFQIFEREMETWTVLGKLGVPATSTSIVRPYVVAGMSEYIVDSEHDLVPTYGLGIELGDPRCDWVVSFDYMMADKVFDTREGLVRGSVDMDTVTVGLSYKF